MASVVRPATAALAREVEMQHQHNQQLTEALLVADKQREEAERAADEYKHEAENALIPLLKELERLREDTALAEEAVQSHRQRAALALDASRKRLQQEETESLQREAEIKERLEQARQDLVTVHAKAETVREESKTLQRLQAEAAALRTRLGRHALPLHRELAQITKDARSSAEQTTTELTRLRDQRTRLAGEVASLTADRNQLSKDLASALEAKQTADDLEVQLAREAVKAAAEVQVEMARAARDGVSIHEWKHVSSSSSAAITTSAMGSDANAGDMSEERHILKEKQGMHQRSEMSGNKFATRSSGLNLLPESLPSGGRGGEEWSNDTDAGMSRVKEALIEVQIEADALLGLRTV